MLTEQRIWIAVRRMECDGQQLTFRLFSVVRGGVPYVLGFRLKSGLDDLLAPALAAGWTPLPMTLPELGRCWPRGHFLAIDPGTSEPVVLAPTQLDSSLQRPRGPAVQ